MEQFCLAWSTDKPWSYKDEDRWEKSQDFFFSNFKWCDYKSKVFTTNSFAKLCLPNTIPKWETGPQVQQSIGTVGLNDCEGASGNPRAPGVLGTWMAAPCTSGANQEIQCNVNMSSDNMKINHRQKNLQKTLIRNAILCCLNYSITNINCYEIFTQFPSSAAEYPRT